jgi:two-component system sensor histidine kinase DctS
MFSVTDHGVGISAAVADKLFTPFFTTKAEGMGLGLSLCRTVIEQHGGFLGHAPALAGGTVFSFTLPASLAGEPAAQLASTQVYAASSMTTGTAT